MLTKSRYDSSIEKVQTNQYMLIIGLQFVHRGELGVRPLRFSKGNPHSAFSDA